MAGNLMIQGTMSGAGKSILTAGILRVLRQDGFRVAPFKSQNMALNSFVTRDGLEMGRAQVVQAAAAGLAPSADMNPILLKPMGDTTSQVIVNGRPIGKMRAADYYRVKRSLIPSILEAYHRLEEKADIIVIEGAGSPVEINLREGDFVNMGLAELVDAPVLLAGNIDPGGVFAQLLGTVQLLRPEERARVKGLIINKFRGDVSLLEPGLAMFREYCDIPFAGVVRWVELDLDEEDSMSERLTGKGRNCAPAPGADMGKELNCVPAAEADMGKELNCVPAPEADMGKELNCVPAPEADLRQGLRAGNGLQADLTAAGEVSGAALGPGAGPIAAGDVAVDIAVIRLPYMSNYTDFSPLEKREDVSLRYVSEASELGAPDLIILPGTKNTIGDLRWLRASGLASRICAMVSPRRARDAGLPGNSGSGTVEAAPLLMGICGGYQMLGKRVLDPLGTESGGEEQGLDLLPIETVFREEKCTRQSGGRTRQLAGAFAALSELPVSGYEIHMGETRYLGNRKSNGLWQDGTPVGSVFAELSGGGCGPAEADGAAVELSAPDGAVSSPAVPDGAVSGHAVLDGAVSGLSVSDGAVSGNAVLDGAVSGLSVPDGAVSGNVLGTYLHGIFDEPAFREALLELLRERKRKFSFGGNAVRYSCAPVIMESARQRQERQLDILADVLRESLDWKLIYKAIGL